MNCSTHQRLSVLASRLLFPAVIASPVEQWERGYKTDREGTHPEPKLALAPWPVCNTTLQVFRTAHKRGQDAGTAPGFL